MGKPNYTSIKTYFQEQGCQLLETEYIGCKHKMKFIHGGGKTSTFLRNVRPVSEGVSR
jgi:hypothetical protein